MAQVYRWSLPALAVLVLCWVLVGAAAADSGEPITTAEAAAAVGRHAMVCGTVASTRYAERSAGQPTFLNLDRAYPNQPFTIVIWGANRSKFGKPERDLQGERVCAAGLVSSYRGRPQIIVDEPSQLRRDNAR